MTTPYQALAHLLHLARRAPVTDDNMTITGQDPVLPTNYLLGTAAVSVIRGFDSLVQSVSGMVHEESKAATPRHLPAQALDYCSGYLMAFGAMMALARRAREGGSYLVRVSLCQTGHWIDTLGRLPDDIDGKRHPMPGYDDLQDLMVDSDSPFGTVRHVAPAVTLSETPARWTCPTADLPT